MSTVSSCTTCPHCSSQECSVDFDTHTNESYLLCYACGYYNITAYENKEGKTTKRVIQEINYPFGCFDYKMKDGLSHSVIALSSERDYIKLLRKLKKLGLHKFECATLSQVIDGRRTITDVLQKG
jgi:hypothetical protein